MAEPFYRQIADDIRGKIRSGEYPVGEPIPSLSKLQEVYEGRSVDVIRAALRLLQAQEVLEGQPGKAIYVRAVPEASQENDLAAEVASLRHRLSGLEADLTYLYDMVGVERVQDQAQAQRPARRKRT
jgi:GntR family transcriptional regulator